MGMISTAILTSVLFVTVKGDEGTYAQGILEDCNMSASNQLREVYLGLCRILRYPEAYGLGPSVPQPLATSLETMLARLGQISGEGEEKLSCEDLATELSQDADSPFHVS